MESLMVKVIKVVLTIIIWMAVLAFLIPFVLFVVPLVYASNG